MDWPSFSCFLFVWMEDKDDAAIFEVLNQTNLLQYFPSGHFHDGFIDFILYAHQLGISEAWFYQPCRELLVDGLFIDEALSLLCLIAEEGDLLSRVFYNIFMIIYDREEAKGPIEDLEDIIESASAVQKIMGWFKIIKKWRLNLWQSAVFDFYEDVPHICDSWMEDEEVHFNGRKCPKSVSDLYDFSCKKCRVKIVMFDFCQDDLV